MWHGRGDDVGMLRLVLSRLRSLGLAQQDRLMEHLYAALKGPLFHRCSADAEQRILRFAALRANLHPVEPKTGLVGDPGPAAARERALLLLPGAYSSARKRASETRPG